MGKLRLVSVHAHMGSVHSGAATYSCAFQGGLCYVPLLIHKWGCSGSLYLLTKSMSCVFSRQWASCILYQLSPIGEMRMHSACQQETYSIILELTHRGGVFIVPCLPMRGAGVWGCASRGVCFVSLHFPKWGAYHVSSLNNWVDMFLLTLALHV